MGTRCELARSLLAEAGDASRFKSDPVPREILDEIIQAASAVSADRPGEAPWRFVVIVGEERERLIARVAEALARHWGLGAVRPRGLASESVLKAPVLLLAFSRIPASEGLDAVIQAAFVAQNIVLLCAAAGLATHRTFGANLVPEAVLDFAGQALGEDLRAGEFVAMLAIGWPESGAGRTVEGAAPEWIGLGDVPPREMVRAAPPPTPAAVLRASGRERVLVVNPYRYDREHLMALLLAAGYQAEALFHGQALLSRVEVGPPAELFVVADNLPDASEFEIVRAARARYRDGEATPLIMTTARRDAAFRIAGLAAGVDYYLRKPVSPIELYTAARLLIEKYRRGTELRRLLTELQTAQARLVQQAKMASLGQLVAGVAHEIHTPLGAVVSNNQMFGRCFGRVRQRVEELGLGHDLVMAQNLDAVESLGGVTRTACERMIAIVRGLQTFARLDEADHKLVDLHEGIESTLLLVSHLLEDRIEVEREYGALPAVECHPNQINQVFMNLVVNACQAIKGPGRIVVRTWHEPATHRVHIAISDTGDGIRADHLERVFDPGFTTKGAGVGTGLGLSICYQIVAAHGGDIRAASEPGDGATFTVTLPAG